MEDDFFVSICEGGRRQRVLFSLLFEVEVELCVLLHFLLWDSFS